MQAHPAFAAAAVRLMARDFGGPELRFATLHSRGGIIAKTLLQPLSAGRWTVFCPVQATIAPLVFDSSAQLDGRALRNLLAQLGSTAWKLDIPYQDSRVSLLQQLGADPTLLTGHWQSVSIAAPEGWEPYWQSRSKDLRHNIERRERKAQRDGFELDLYSVHNPDEIGAAVDRYCDLETRGWKGEAGTALGRRQIEGRFYRELMVTMAQQKCACVYELRAGDRVIASRLVLSGGSRHLVLKTTYDESLKAYSPGVLLLHRMLRELFSVPGRTVELCTHAKPQQLQWATGVPSMQNRAVFRSALIRSVFDLRARVRARHEWRQPHRSSRSAANPR
jgi:GNAT acetyltransferase-like protein